MRNSDKGKRLSAAEWLEIRNRFMAGVRITALAVEFNVSREAISRRASREEWRRPEEIRAEAVQELQEEKKEDYKKMALDANMQQLLAYKFIAAISLNQLRDLKEGKLPGARAYQLKVLADTTKLGLDGIRQALRLDDLNCPFNTEGGERDDLSSVQRLLQIMRPVPSAPYALAAEVDDGQVQLSWKREAGELEGFRVERADSLKLDFATIGTLPADATAYSDKKVKEKASYAYRVFATNEAGDSIPSGTLAVTILAAVSD